MSHLPPPHAAVLTGPLGQHDPAAERLQRAEWDRRALRLRRARRLRRWSERIARMAGILAGVASALQARERRASVR